MNSGIQISVVLPCYNGGELLNVQLEALATQQHDEPWELLFLDNASTDGSSNVARQYEARIPNLRIIDASAERGQPYALNLGIGLARGPMIITCDADDEVAPGWLNAMARALREHRFVASRMDQTKIEPALASIQSTIRGFTRTLVSPAATLRGGRHAWIPQVIV